MVAMRFGTNKLAEQETASGGSTETKTLLWSNPNPSASFSGQNVTLSGTITDFDFFEIEYAYNNTSRADQQSKVRFPVLDSNGNYFQQRAYYFNGAFGFRNGSAVGFVRLVDFPSVTSLHFSGCTQVGGTSGANTGAIPLNVYGIKTNS